MRNFQGGRISSMVSQFQPMGHSICKPCMNLLVLWVQLFHGIFLSSCIVLRSGLHQHVAAIVLKPAEQTPLTALFISKLLYEVDHERNFCSLYIKVLCLMRLHLRFYHLCLNSSFQHISCSFYSDHMSFVTGWTSSRCSKCDPWLWSNCWCSYCQSYECG